MDDREQKGSGFAAARHRGGEKIAPLAEPRTWKAWFSGQRCQMYAWRCVYQGHVYSGRNGGLFGGEGCLVRMRRGAAAAEGKS